MAQLGRKTVSDIITDEEIASWSYKELVTITSGTGAGKSYFVKNKLYEYAKKLGKKILMLIHRKPPAEQFALEIIRDGKSDVIDIMTYQKIENCINNGSTFDFHEYEYIICDEFHYFCSDARFNNCTDISFYAILSYDKAIRIYMSATPDEMTEVFSKFQHHHKIENVKRYVLPPTYDHINKLTFYYKDVSVEKLLDLFKKNGNKAIVFCDSCKKAYSLYKKFCNDSLFLCSNSNSHYKYVDIEAIEKMLQDERFETQFLISTACFDAGANIIDKAVTKIIIDIKDVGSLIQCMGRKRIQDNDDKIDVYIKGYNNNQIGAFKSRVLKSLNQVEFFKDNGEKEYVEKFGRDIDSSGGVIYDEIADGHTTKKINWLMYYKKIYDKDLFSDMISYGEYGYCIYLAKKCNCLDESDKCNYSVLFESYDAEYFLAEMRVAGKIIYSKKDRKELIEKINVRSDGKLLKNINTLNSALREKGSAFQIKEFETRYNGKRYRHAWRIVTHGE